jgi:hypothetical protein
MTLSTGSNLSRHTRQATNMSKNTPKRQPRTVIITPLLDHLYLSMDFPRAIPDFLYGRRILTSRTWLPTLGCRPSG